jgi:hypothetical protein
MKDLMEPSHRIKIQFSLESGVNSVVVAQNTPFVNGLQDITLYPGTPVTLTNIDLRPLFRLDNLTGINAVNYARPLPEGSYKFCFQVFDAGTGRALSAKAAAIAYLVQYDPPMLNLPQQGEKIVKQNEFQHIIFQWTPRQMAPNTKYIFTLKELWDNLRDPVSGFLASRALWQEETYAPALYYGIDKTALLPGKRYAWQVQAKSGNPVTGNSPTEDNGVYKNNGLSEIFYFDYTENCLVPVMLMAKNAGRGKTEIRWTMTGGSSGNLYRVQYRKKGSTAEWSQQESYQDMCILTGLKDETEYEYRIGSVCGNLYQTGNTGMITGNDAADNAYAFSGIQFFTTDSKSTANANIQCGILPQVDTSDKSPLKTALGTNEVFMAGDFPVTVLQSQGTSGTYSGYGYIQVSYLADTKIKVTFNNIKLNTGKQLIEGIIETTYDVNESSLTYVSQGIGETFGDQGMQPVIVNYVISEIQYSATPPPGKITIIGNSGKGNNDDSGSGESSRQELPAGKDYAITDKEGNVWHVDEEGNVAKGEKVAQGGASTSDNTEGISGSGTNAKVEQYTAKGVSIRWYETPATKYAYDTADGKPEALKAKYPTVTDADGNTVYVSYKAVVNTQTDVLGAKVTFSDPALKGQKVIFKTLETGQEIAARNSTDDDYTLTLNGTMNYAEEDVIAVLMPKDSTQKQQLIGSFKLVHLEPKEINVALVPTDDVSKGKLQSIKEETASIYSKAGVTVNFSEDAVFDITPYLEGNAKIPTEKNSLLSTYSSVQQSINRAYDNRNNNLYVLFVTDKESSTGQMGYMRLGGQFGYIFKSPAGKTAAHELGHGVFKLEHPWEQYNTSEGATDLLMDYSNGTALTHLDWKQINDPKLKFYVFQGQDEGEFGKGYAISPNYKIFRVASSILADKTDYVSNPDLKNDGTLPGFKLEDKYYYWDYSKNEYVAETTDGKQSPYKLQELSINSLDNEKVIYLFFDKAEKCGKGSFKKVNVKDLKSFKGRLEDFIFTNNADKKFLPCNTPGTSGSSNKDVDFVKANEDDEGQTTEDECSYFVYHNSYSKEDKDLVKETFLTALQNRQRINSEERVLNNRTHIQIIGDGEANNEIELLEDKLHLLSYYKPDVFISIVFVKKDYKSYYTTTALKNMALDVITESKGQLQDKKVLLIIVPYSTQLNVDNTCLRVGYAQTNNNDLVNYSTVEIDDNKTWYQNIFNIYSQVSKPLTINRYYKLADGKIIRRIDKSSHDVQGYPFIKTLNFYESKGYDDIRALNEKWKNTGHTTNLGLYLEYRKEAEQIYFDYISKEEQEGSINNPDIWKQINNDDLGKFREVYMDDVGLTNELWEKSKDSWAWGSKVEIALNINKVQLQPKHFYNFDKIVLLDDVIYGTLDGIGLIPGIDTFTDPIGAVYAGIREDYTNTIIYSASFSIPLAGSAYIKGALHVSEDAGKLYGIIARNADNVDGYILDIKKISEITTDEVHVSSIFFGADEKLTRKVLNEITEDTHKYIDGDNLRNVLKSKNATNLVKEDAKKLIIETFGRATKFADDPKTIEKVAEFLTDTNKDALKSIGGKEGLQDIIRANVRAGCITCGTASTNFLKNMDEYLDDVLDFANNYSKVNGYKDVIKELKKVNNTGSPNYAMEGASFMIDKIRRTPEITPSTVKKFDGRFEGEIEHICENCRLDIELTNGTTSEYKSYSETSINRISTSEPFLKQHLNYLSETSDISKLRYEFDASKFSDRQKIVEQFKKMYQKNPKEIFNSNPELFRKYNSVDGVKIEDWEDFKTFINDERLNMNHPIFNFIKTE